ncbi:MAG: NAD-dependent epimerase/dehydratase family protein, partial [Hyphomicrobiales bacterium]
MRVAVTGGTGFIGRALVESLSRDGITVHILTRRAKDTFSVPIRAFHADLTDPHSCLGPFLNGVDTLYHCAGELRDPKAMRALHVDGTGRLIDAATSAGIKCWVQLSSVGAYGPRRSGEVTE